MPTTKYFLFRGKLYKQRYGAAMVSLVFPVVDNLYMEFLEPPLLKKYIVNLDFGNVCGQCFAKVQKIRWTILPCISTKLAQQTALKLDTLIIHKPDGSVKLLIYLKATHTDHYLNFSSHHSINHKLGVVRTLLDYSNFVITDPKDRGLEEEKIRVALRRCRYPNWTFKRVKQKMDNK